MRILTIFRLILSFAFFAVLYFLATGALSINTLFDAYDRFSSGVIGQPAEASHSMTTTVTIAPLDGYRYAGQLDATMTFTDDDGAETVFDLHYPTDYNFFHDGFGPLWLANWRSDIANNPQVSPVLGNSCLQTINGQNLAPNGRYRMGYKEYLVCRVLDEEGLDAPREYDIARAKPAVIGVIWSNLTHQPMEDSRERCVAEARIWAIEIAKPDDRFMACVFVVNEEPQQVEIYAFELTEDSIVEVSGASEGWSRATVNVRDATRLEQYRLMQNWRVDPQAYAAAVGRAHSHIAANLDLVVSSRVSRFDGITQDSGHINFAFSARNTHEMFRIRDDGGVDDAPRYLYQHIRKLVCGSTERAALLAFQENEATYLYDLNDSEGKPMTRYGTFPNLPC